MAGPSHADGQPEGAAGHTCMESARSTLEVPTTTPGPNYFPKKLPEQRLCTVLEKQPKMVVGKILGSVLALAAAVAYGPGLPVRDGELEAAFAGKRAVVCGASYGIGAEVSSSPTRFPRAG